MGLVLAPAIAWLYRRRRYLYIAGVLVNGFGMLVASHHGWLSGLDDVAYDNIICLALPVVGWLWIERTRIATRDSTARLAGPPFHRVATRLAVGLLALVAAIGLAGDAAQQGFVPTTPGLQWAALAATAIAAMACLWDAGAIDAVATLYLLGLVGAAMALHDSRCAYSLPQAWLLWLGMIFVAAYALATSYLWSCRRGLTAWAAALRMPRRSEAELSGLAWLVPANLFLVAAVVAMTLAIELTDHEMPRRLLAAQAVLAQVISVALLACGDRRGVLQAIALHLGAARAALFALAFLQVDTTLTLLHALVAVAAALAVVAVVYGFGLGKLLRETSDWLPPARALTPILAAASAAMVVAAVGVEVYEFATLGEVAVAPAAIAAIALTLAGAVVAALAAAVLPGRDPLSLSERGRTLYVYAAEIALAMVFIHVRVTLPWLFTGFFQRYWPLIVMAIAFVGVGFAEFCRRRKLDVLAQPVENTGSPLPVLPVIAFWTVDSQVDYSLLLTLVGVLYAGLSIARRSFGFGVLAALAANGGLWFFLDRQEGWGFLAHPQVWLIPPALCVLAAAYLNRQQLSDEMMTRIRYLASMTIYLSSTGDIFLNGVAQQPALPLVLAGLSVVGILAGMALRVRAFLFLGTGFLVLALFTMIYHAAVDLEQTWVWWASGLVLGLAIMAGVGFFERKRQGVLEMVERVKRWEG